MGAAKQKSYLAIDLKSYYSSVECADRHLDPLRTHLVVADASRTEKTICLAVSPSLKAYGIGGRCRLFEVVEKTREINAERLRKAPNHAFSSASFDADALEQDPNMELSYIVAPPRMARYLEVSTQIYSIYLKYIAPEDIFAYSIDEVFIDATPYLKNYHMDAHSLAMTLMRSVRYETGITATCGIGTNLYLAKIAMDIVAKKAQPDKDGVRIAALDEISYRRLLWDHRPLTDFWRIGRGTANKLEAHYIHTMGDLARASCYDQEWFYKTFGVDAEILIDHAWGIEPVTMAHIKAFRPENNSICDGQVLSEPYTWEKARVIVQEMSENLAYQLLDRQRAAGLLTLDIGYDHESVNRGFFSGEVHIDHYGRAVPKPAHGSTRLQTPSNTASRISEALLALFDRIAGRDLLVRRISITAGNLVQNWDAMQLDLFTDTERLQQEQKLQRTIADIKHRYGKNAILKGTNFKEGATMQQRNQQIGGHHE